MPGREMTTDARQWWLIVRNYRGKRRVLSMHGALSEAETAYDKAVRDLRDGDVILASALLDTLRIQSGGYNRTRW